MDRTGTRVGPLRRDALWSRPFVLAITINFFISVVFISLVATIALYAIERFHAGEDLAGLAAGSFILGAVVSRLLFSRFIDTFGRRRTILLTLSVFLVASLLYLWVGDLSALVALRFTHGASFGVAHTAISTVALALVPKTRRGEGTGYYGLSAAIANGLGPFVGITVTANLPTEWVFAVASGFAFFALTLALFLRPPEADVFGQRPAWRFRFADLLEPAALPVTFVLSLCGVVYSGVAVFLGAYALQLGAPELAAVFFLLYSAGVVTSRLFVGRLQDTFGDNAVMYPLFLIFAIGALILGTAPNAGWMLVAAVFLGMGFGALSTGAQTITVKLVPPERLATAVSTFYTVVDVGFGVGPIVLGVLATATGYAGMYLISVGVIVLSGLLYFLVYGRTAQRSAAASR